VGYIRQNASPAERSGKGMELPPSSPLRTGQVPFDTSGSSLSFRRWHPTGLLNSQSGRMELEMTHITIWKHNMPQSTC
jgi:hypothetical protein